MKDFSSKTDTNRNFYQPENTYIIPSIDLLCALIVLFICV